MEYDERDHEVVALLSRLKETGSSYPVDLLALRRQRFVKQVAAFGFGTVAALALKETAKAAGGTPIPPVAGILLETALIVAIVAEAGYVAIVHRERVVDWFRTALTGPAAEVIRSSPEPDSPPLEMPVTGPTLPTVEVETVVPTIVVTETPTRTLTPTPPLPLVTETEQIESDSEAVEVSSTPEPQEEDDNQFIPTPRAERTQESGGGGGGSDPEKDDPKPEGDGNEGDKKDPRK